MALLGDVWVEQEVVLVAKNESAEVEESFTAIPIPPSPVAALPAGMQDGVNYIDGSTVLLSLYAPLKSFAFARGDFNDWAADEASYMNRTPGGDRFWIELTGLTAGVDYAYQYFVDGSVSISDPYAELVLDPWNDQYIPEATYPDLKPYPAGQEGLVSVLQTNQQPFEWQNEDFEAPAVTDLVVYELLIRDFLLSGDYADPLAYAIDYYVHYPKVALGHWPPLFHLVSAAWMMLFSASRISLLLMMAFLAALLGWSVYLSARKELGKPTAMALAAIALLLPVVQEWSLAVMRETLEQLSLPYVMFGPDTPVSLVAEYAAKLVQALNS